MAADRSHYLAVLEDLESQRARLDQAIVLIRHLLGIESEAPTTVSAPAAPSRPPGESNIPRNAYSGLSLPESIKSYLRAVNQRQTPKQIHEGIVRGGFHTKAKKLYANVYTTLLRLEQAGEAVKVENEWGLAEWYPAGRKSAPRPPERSDAGSTLIPSFTDVVAQIAAASKNSAA